MIYKLGGCNKVAAVWRLLPGARGVYDNDYHCGRSARWNLVPQYLGDDEDCCRI